MKRIYSHIIYTCLSVVLLAGCSIDYPDNDFWGKVAYENPDARVPLLVAIDDLQGTFDNIKDEEKNTISEAWANADIYVYGFYTPTDVKGAVENVDYSERMNSQDDEKIYCLVDDAENDSVGHGKKARLNRDLTSFLQWKDNDMVYYNSTYPEYSYKFFAYYLDNAADMTKGPVRDTESVTYEISINGKQELMCGHTTLCPYGAEGNLDIFPVFEMKRQLALLKFDNPDAHVKSVMIDAPYRGRFVVAADDETRIGVKFDPSETKSYNSEEVGMDFLLPEADSYALQVLTDTKDEPVNGVLRLDEGFKAGQKYMVTIKVGDSGDIELDVK